jgi:hypothetical protein
MKLINLALVFTLLSCSKSNNEKIEKIEKVETVPLAPTELKTNIISKDQIDLTWKDNSSNEIGFKIERKIGTSDFAEIGITDQNTVSFSDKTVTINTNYIYRIYSYNNVGKSIQYSNESNIQHINIPTISTKNITDISGNSSKTGGTITSDGGSSITSRGIVWDTKSNPTIVLTTKTTDSIGIGEFKSSISGLMTNTKYFVRAYATNLAGTSYGNEESFTTLSFNTVIGANNRIWMDRNLGATRVATSNSDEEGFGDLYQWGRNSDGHQIKTSGTSNNLSNTDLVNNNLFIITSSEPYDWRVPQNNLLWQGVNGINNPCPKGFRIPTYEEWEIEVASWPPQLVNNKPIWGVMSAYSSALKLPLPNTRNTIGNIISISYSEYWTSTVPTGSSGAIALIFNSKMNNYGFTTGGDRRANGFSCRCIKD